MQASKFVLSLACAAMVVSCGGGGSSPTPSPSATAPAPTPTPTSTTANCSYTTRSQFVRDTFNEWYLFPELLNTGANPASYTDLQDYIDALVAPARAQGRDRFFSYITSIAEENAFYEGGASAGFGFRLFYNTGASKVFVTETFEGTSALGANVDRGSEVLGVGTTSSNIVSVTTLMARGGAYAVYEALGPSNAGVMRVLRVRDQGGVEREVSLTKTEFALDPVSNRYGAKIIDDGGRRVGYLNFRTFIDPAVPDLRSAFANFRAQGVTELVIDLRYNGGGLVSIAELMGDLMARDLDGRVFYELALRPSKAAENEIYRFDAQPQSVAPTRVAFIGTGETASASELVVNGMQPYLGDRMALIGENTYGKPVGQAAFDLPGCDDRVRVIAFKLANADGEGEYFNGLAATVPNACRAEDDVAFQLGDPREGMLASALDFLAGRACTPIISAASARRVAVDTGERGMLRAEVPGTVAQREVPGLN